MHPQYIVLLICSISINVYVNHTFVKESFLSISQKQAVPIHIRPRSLAPQTIFCYQYSLDIQVRSAYASPVNKQYLVKSKRKRRFPLVEGLVAVAVPSPQSSYFYRTKSTHNTIVFSGGYDYA